MIDQIGELAKDLIGVTSALLVLLMAITLVSSVLAGIWTAATYTPADTTGALIFGAIVAALTLAKRINATIKVKE